MAASIPPLDCAPPLSHKQRKAASRKERRKRKRQAMARIRECAAAQNGVDPPEEVDEEDDEDDRIVEEERQRLHEEWLERERLAQEEFRLKSEREEAVRKRREEDERKIKEEWEAQQRREEEEKEQKQQEKRDREEAVQKMLDEAENQLTNGGPWMNPEAPVTERTENYGTERDAANCPFFLKTGSCRFGDRCSRKHVYPLSSPTLMIRAMFITYGMEQSRRDDYDGDASLEYSEEELHESFTEFYHDVLPEFRTVGKVVQFKVSCNHEPHLRGNVYVQFETEEQCKEAFIKFNGRWYAGKQLHCEICPVTRWKNAICGLFDRKRCPKGKNCNFLHVFRNPGNEFWEADRDLNISPDRSIKGSHSERHSERSGDRSWRSHRSPPRSERSYSRREDERHSERSRDRRTSHHQRDDSRRPFRLAHYDRGRARCRSREKSRSRSRDRKSRDRDRNVRSRDKSEEKDRNGGAERNKPGREKRKHLSPYKEDEKQNNPDAENKRHRHHKHSKKSKKKSKKKHKKRSSSPEAMTSSKESDEEETVDRLSKKSPSGEKGENNDDLSASPSTEAEKPITEGHTLSS